MAKVPGRKESFNWRVASVDNLEKAPNCAAIYSDGGAVDVTGALGSEKGYDGSKFLWCSQTAGGDARRPTCKDFLRGCAGARGLHGGEFLQPVGLGVAGTNVIYGDTVRGVLIGKGASHARDGGAYRIGEQKTVNRLLDRIGSNGDKTPPMIFLHAGKNFFCEGYGAYEEQVHGGAPVFDSCIRKRFRRGAAGIGDTDVDFFEVFFDGGDKSGNRGGIGDVDRLVENLAARNFLNFRGGVLQRGSRAGANSDVGAFFSEFLSDSAAKPFAGGSNDSDATLQAKVHCESSMQNNNRLANWEAGQIGSNLRLFEGEPGGESKAAADASNACGAIMALAVR